MDIKPFCLLKFLYCKIGETGEGREELKQGCQTHFHQGPHQTHSCLQRAECNFNSSAVTEQLHLYNPKIYISAL